MTATVLFIIHSVSRLLPAMAIRLIVNVAFVDISLEVILSESLHEGLQRWSVL